MSVDSSPPVFIVILAADAFKADSLTYTQCSLRYGGSQECVDAAYAGNPKGELVLPAPGVFYVVRTVIVALILHCKFLPSRPGVCVRRFNRFWHLASPNDSSHTDPCAALTALDQQCLRVSA
jgi:hypothetical protein